MTDRIDEQSRLATLFAGLEGVRIDRLGMLSDIQREPVWQHLRAMNCDVKWVREDDLSVFKETGWAPVINRASAAGTVYMDRAGTQVLMFKAPAQPAGGEIVD